VYPKPPFAKSRYRFPLSPIIPVSEINYLVQVPIEKPVYFHRRQKPQNVGGIVGIKNFTYYRKQLIIPYFS
jgi:hypothetical protein